MRASVRACVRKLTSIPAVVQQIVTNKSCLVCVMSEQYAPSDPSQTPAAEAKPRYVLGWSKLSKMLPSFSPRNLRIFENHPRKILNHELALILILEPRRCSYSHLKF